MIDPWWAKESGLWLLPLALGGPLAPILVWHAKRARHRTPVMLTLIALTVLYGLVAAAGVIAKVVGQPAYIWAPLLYPGLCTAMAYGITLRMARQLYVRVELLKSIALDI